MACNSFKRSMVFSFTSLLLLPACLAQSIPPPAASPSPASEIRQEFAKNEARLRHYQWIETTTVTIDGKTRPPRQSVCRYTPDGRLQKTPLGPPVSFLGQLGGRRRGGPLRKEIVKKKIEKIEGEAKEIRAVVGMYLPLNREKLAEAFRANQLAFERSARGKSIVLTDYAKPGDRLTLAMSASPMRMERVDLKTYLDKPKDVLTVNVQFAELADGTTYPSITTVSAPSKKLSITSVRSDFSKPVE